MLRDLPSVDRLLSGAEDLRERYGHALLVEALRTALGDARQHMLAGGDLPDDETLIAQAADHLRSWLSPSLRPVINATGVIIHTNLGRAPLSDEAVTAMQAVAGGYSTLEFDLESGSRGSRETHAAALLKRLTGAEAALMVNNNAAATMLTLSALAGGGQGVVVSRGQLVEIGGGYRMPDVMAASGARLVEVGTTNRTHLADYKRAIQTGDVTALMRVHHSNYRVVGFTTEPTIEELADLAQAHSVLLIDDIGSGALLSTAEFGLAEEPTVPRSIAAGVDVALFSGDKLLGGPQAGVIVGRAEMVERIRRHPMARAVRADKLAISAMTATLRHYLRGEALEKIPVWRMISTPLAAITQRAEAWAARLGGEVIAGESTVGGGSVPGSSLPTALLAVDSPSAERLAARLRAADPPIIARIENDRLLLDPRTVLARQEEALLTALEKESNA